MIDITGEKFGKLTAIREVGRGKWNKRRYLCSCDCGKAKLVTFDHLRSGSSKSCGCVAAKKASERLTKHGMHNTKVYGAWHNIKARCNKPNNKHYHNYGGRGIKMCVEWEESFEAFYADMGDPPSSSHSVERVDNNKGYEPSNCKWATPIEQAVNKNFKTRDLPLGVTVRKNRYNVNIKYNQKQHWLGTFDTPEEASTWRDAYIIANGWPHRLNYVEVLERGSL